MKIGIVSDFHIGYERFADDAYKQAKEALESAAKLSDALIIPGDIFDKRAPHPEFIAQAINIFRGLKNREWQAKVTNFEAIRNGKVYTNVPVVAIPGTHERTTEGKENPLTLLGLAGLLVDASEAYVILEKGDEKIRIFGMGGISEDRVKDVLKELNPSPAAGYFNIFVFHQSLFELLPFNNSFLRYEELPEGFDLYIDGHIHNKIIGKVHGKDFLIPGSTVITQLKEVEQEKKGFFVYDTLTGAIDFHEIESRPFFLLNVNIEGKSISEIEKKANEGIDKIVKACKEKPIIRLVLEGTLEKNIKITDLPIREIERNSKDKAILEIDRKDLVDAAEKNNIEELREGKMGGLPIKEQGILILQNALKDEAYLSKLNPIELFDILGNEAKSKEKIIKEATEFIEKFLKENGE
ncbi:MAG: metallophosphoesterase [Candidatus Micrarchaeaceae archaeon]